MPDHVLTRGWTISAKRTALVVALGVVARIILAAVLGLGVDESYEVVMSRVPSLGYFDHPPLSFWIPGLVADLAGTENRVLLRLPFILLFAGTTILMYRLTARLYGPRAGFVSALLLNISPVFSLSTGGWILPDGPLDFGIVAAALCLTHSLLDAGGWRWWLLAGVWTGVALLSKYHGAFVLAGTLLFVVTHRSSRVWLRRPEPYVATLIALAIASPMLIWNVRHNFASIRFQAGRATTHGVHLAALAQNLAGQIGYLLPWIWVPLAWQLVRALRRGPSEAQSWLLTCLAVGPIAVFTLVSLGGNPGLPHWPAPGYLLLFPLAGAAAARYEERGPHGQMLMRRGLTTATLVFVVLVGIAATDVATGWAARVAPSLFVRGDPSLEAMDWTALAPELAREGLLPQGGLVAATHWIDASKIGYALGPAYTVICLSDDPRGFQFAHPPDEYVGQDMLLLVRTGRGVRPVDVPARYGRYFRAITPADTVPIRRAGRVELSVAVFRMHELLRWSDSAAR